ncbi:MAG: ABC transporter ATP-binding protein [Planctomycetota bacterium]
MLEIRNLKKSFGSTVAVESLDLTLGEGEVLGLLGPNGAGKTTTVSMITGLVHPDSGSVSIRGEGSPSSPSIRRHIGVAPQTLAIYEELTGRENVEFFGRLQGLRGKSLTERARQTLETVGLLDRAKDRAGKYSGGMKRRLNLAIALIHDPPCLILDEPTAGVDPQSRNVILELIESLRRDGRSVLYTTHYMEEAQRICDRVAILDHGRLLAQGTLGELVDGHGGRDRLTVVRPGGDVEQIETDEPLTALETMREKGPLERFQLDRPNLETVFLNLTGRQLRD